MFARDICRFHSLNQTIHRAMYFPKIKGSARGLDGSTTHKSSAWSRAGDSGIWVRRELCVGSLGTHLSAAGPLATGEVKAAGPEEREAARCGDGGKDANLRDLVERRHRGEIERD